ncbi:hypothetical protein ACFL3B_00680 [Gemmatimonadota bacterium]
MNKYFVPLLFAVFYVGCGSDMPTGTDGPMPNFAVAGNSGCFAVSGAIDQEGIGAISGVISGDVEGTIATVSGPAVINGVVVHRPVEQTWEVSGGTVEALIGETLTFEVDFTGIIQKWPMIRIKNTARVVEGAQKGNLTQHGMTDATAAPWMSVHLQYRGVICP